MQRIPLLGILMFLGSLVFTPWFTESASRPDTANEISDAERLASYSISRRTDLIEAVVAIGMHKSTYMRGNIDSLRRVDDQHAIMDGWLADLHGSPNPLSFVVFVGGKKAAVAQTSGERPDVTKAFSLAFGANKNVGFQVRFRCPSGDQPFIVGVSQDREYVQLTSPPCP